MNIEEIRKNKPDGATHFTIIIFVGVTYIKYINNFPNYWNHGWLKCNSYFEAEPL